jgi:hypothetical protein
MKSNIRKFSSLETLRLEKQRLHDLAGYKQREIESKWNHLNDNFGEILILQIINSKGIASKLSAAAGNFTGGLLKGLLVTVLKAERTPDWIKKIILNIYPQP